ncbi:GNAT family N-acetyltransferase [Vibrio sp. Isolate30]|uniref:GNAT family N-acetyltransferase n=1 Tax=Vibrio sp. Isolate30 TaxID=2908536 RepID=UPI001EFC8838|nr:GNAT family N-acetyltransferase [Vibrio sp. Isolate30]MCG9633352.1 GNAT family N-acetyltransferase [Vibrio sp. Isolate30]
MEISDYQQVMNLWSETEGMRLREADSEENIGKYLERNPNLSFVAVQGEQIVGAILVGTDGRRGYIQHLAVSKACRGQGIGAKLISNAVDALSSIGIAKTHLFVINDNLNAQAFYENIGWYPRDEVRMFSFNASTVGNI